MSALTSALLGAGLVSASSLLTLAVARASSRAGGTVAAPALAMTYVLKVFVLGWVLFTVPAPAWLSPGWLGAGVLGALVVWLLVAGRLARGRSREAAASRAQLRDPGTREEGA